MYNSAFAFEKFLAERWESLPLQGLESWGKKLAFSILERVVNYKKKTVTFDATSYECLFLGDPKNRPFVWLHGFSDNKYSFSRVAMKLSRKFYVVIPDLPGFDNSTQLIHQEYNLDYYTAYVAALFQQLELKDAILAGNSLGGAIALQLAAQRGELVSHIMPVNTAGVLGPTLRGFYRELLSGHNIFHITSYRDFEYFLGRIFYRLPPLPFPLKLFVYRELRHNSFWYNKLMSDLTHGLFGAEGLKEARQYKNFGLDNMLSQVNCPTDIIWGEQDSLFPLELGYYLTEKIRKASLHIITNCGHCPHLEAPEHLAHLFLKLA
ncbi:MAG: alpha/beta hydrolase [Leptospiraceae bacterium]|nr:alpha/beta hydrolase [Leptospiraceae bacterium]MDW8306106.1 alpha/beta hydrolase [Leptospiraceae bacterium]